MTIGNVLSIIGLCFTFFFSTFALFFTVKNNKKADVSDIKEDTAESIREKEEQIKNYELINLKLDGIKGTTLEIKEQISNVTKDVKDHDKQITIIGQQITAMHDRQDRMDARLLKLEE